MDCSVEKIVCIVTMLVMCKRTKSILCPRYPVYLSAKLMQNVFADIRDVAIIQSGLKIVKQTYRQSKDNFCFFVSNILCVHVQLSSSLVFVSVGVI